MPQPKPAIVEDYNSDDSSAVPGTIVQADQSGRRAAQPASRQQKPVARSKSRAPAPPASDSGYSSHASAPQATTKSPAPPRVVIDPSARKAVQPPAVASPTKSSRPKPQIHRNDSARITTTRPQPVSSPAPAQDGRRCSDPNCVDPNCERRYTLPQRQQPPPPQVHQQQHPTYSQPQYPQYPQQPPMQAPPPPGMMGPPPVPVPRQRSGSISRARPVSIHGYSSMSYAGAQPGPPQAFASISHAGPRPGPPPSASAYYAYNQPSQPAYPEQSPAYAGNMAPPPAMDYPPSSPVVPASPSSPSMHSGFSGFPGNYSARQANPNVPGLDMPKPMPMPKPGLSLQRTVSARRPDERASGRRASYVGESDSADSYSESATGSESEYDSEYERRQRRKSHRNSRSMAPAVAPARRPSMSTKYVSESVVPKTRKEARPLEVTRTKTSQSDHLLDYPSSSEIGDSDRTARAVIHRRDARDGREAYSERSSRRQSVSSKGSSTRTKPSSLSSVTDYSRVIVEGPNGRRTAYLSKNEQADLIRRYQQQKLEDKLEEDRIRQEKIEAYQRATSGESYDLTAENIKKHSSARKTTSRVSGRSQKSTGSGSKMSGDNRGVKIQSGDTVLHIYGEANIEMRPGEDGGPASFVIGSSNGKETSYLGSSKGSSNSRLGRTRSRREPIREEEYEPGL